MICYDLFFIHIKISYYCFNRQELLQKANDRYDNCGSKEKAAEYCIANKDILNGSTNNTYRNFSEEEKEVKR